MILAKILENFDSAIKNDQMVEVITRSTINKKNLNLGFSIRKMLPKGKEEIKDKLEDMKLILSDLDSQFYEHPWVQYASNMSSLRIIEDSKVFKGKDILEVRAYADEIIKQPVPICELVYREENTGKTVSRPALIRTHQCGGDKTHLYFEILDENSRYNAIPLENVVAIMKRPARDAFLIYQPNLNNAGVKPAAIPKKTQEILDRRFGGHRLDDSIGTFVYPALLSRKEYNAAFMDKMLHEQNIMRKLELASIEGERLFIETASFEKGRMLRNVYSVGEGKSKPGLDSGTWTFVNLSSPNKQKPIHFMTQNLYQIEDIIPTGDKNKEKADATIKNMLKHSQPQV